MFVVGILDVDVLDWEICALRLEGVVEEDEDGLAEGAFNLLDFDAFFDAPLTFGIAYVILLKNPYLFNVTRRWMG